MPYLILLLVIFLLFGFAYLLYLAGLVVLYFMVVAFEAALIKYGQWLALGTLVAAWLLPWFVLIPLLFVALCLLNPSEEEAEAIIHQQYPKSYIRHPTSSPHS